MKGSRPNQAELTKNNDLSKTKKTQEVIESMVDGLNDHRICLLYTSPSPRDKCRSRMPSSA